MNVYRCETFHFLEVFNSKNYYDGNDRRKNQPIYLKKNYFFIDYKK